MTAMPNEETQIIGLVRNALMVAGQEMGAEGDHWPVINSTIQSIMQEWEKLQVERNADAELRVHLYEQLEIMERGLKGCPSHVQTEVAPKLKHLRELYDAYFSSLNEKAAVLKADEVPVHIQRAKAIIKTLEGSHD